MLLRYPIYKRLNYLSLDIVLGAVFSATLTASIFPFVLSWWYYIVLASSVWVIYTLDHLIDCQRNKEKTNSPRHLFYFTNFKLIIWIVGFVSSGIGLLLVFYTSIKLLLFGLALGSISLIYLGFVFWLRKPSIWLPKELIVAFIYTIGIWGYPVLLQNSCNLQYLLFPLFFLLLVFFVLVFYSYLDLEEDLADHFYGLLSVISKKSSEKLLVVILVLEVIVFLLILSAFSLWMFKVPIISYIIMLLMTFALFWYRKSLKHKGYYRALGEAIFFIPGIVIGFYEMLTFAQKIL